MNRDSVMIKILADLFMTLVWIASVAFVVFNLIR